MNRTVDSYSYHPDSVNLFVWIFIIDLVSDANQ